MEANLWKPPPHQVYSTPSSLFALKGVVALSNAGVTLLQRHDYRSSSFALKEAMKGLKGFFSDDEDLTSHLFQQRLNETLFFVNQSVASSQYPTMTDPTCEAIEISLQELDMPTVKSLLRTAISLEANERPIRITNCGSGSYTYQDVEFISSVILYNFALARRYYGVEVEQVGFVRIVVLQGSHRFCSLALASLQGQHTKCTDDAHMVLILTVCSLVLRNLMALSAELALPAETNLYAAYIADVQQTAYSMLQQFESTWVGILHDNVASAA